MSQERERFIFVQNSVQRLLHIFILGYFELALQYGVYVKTNLFSLSSFSRKVAGLYGGLICKYRWDRCHFLFMVCFCLVIASLQFSVQLLLLILKMLFNWSFTPLFTLPHKDAVCYAVMLPKTQTAPR